MAVKDMASAPAGAVGITATLIGELNLADSPYDPLIVQAVTAVANDITEGLGNLDSSALPASVTSLSATIKNLWTMESVEFGVTTDVIEGPDTLIGYPIRIRGLDSSPSLIAGVTAQLNKIQDMAATPGAVGAVTAPLVADITMDSEPGLVASISAALQADISLNIECLYDLDPWQLDMVCSLVSAPVSILGLGASPTLIADISTAALAQIFTIAATPALVTTLEGRIVSKYSEEVPCDRIISLCPKERDIVLNCQPRFM
jgi:hypothetical protein